MNRVNEPLAKRASGRGLEGEQYTWGGWRTNTPRLWNDFGIQVVSRLEQREAQLVAGSVFASGPEDGRWPQWAQKSRL